MVNRKRKPTTLVATYSVTYFEEATQQLKNILMVAQNGEKATDLFNEKYDPLANRLVDVHIHSIV